MSSIATQYIIEKTFRIAKVSPPLMLSPALFRRKHYIT